jgi:manganese transport protein
VPGLDGPGSLYLATGILGATVMPHVIYLHSALAKDRTPGRDDRDLGRLIRF